MHLAVKMIHDSWCALSLSFTFSCTLTFRSGDIGACHSRTSTIHIMMQMYRLLIKASLNPLFDDHIDQNVNIKKQQQIMCGRSNQYAQCIQTNFSRFYIFHSCIFTFVNTWDLLYRLKIK